MIIQESKLLRESVEQYLILESRQILLENIKNNPRHYFIINENYKKYCTEEEWRILEEGVWDTIKGVAGSIGDYFSEDPRKGIQAVADIVSIFDPTGIVDLVNGIFYYYFKDYFSAFFSFLGAALTMGGLILGVVTAETVVGAAAGIAMEATGKAVQTTKVAIKAGKVGSAAVKDIALATKAATPAIRKVAMMAEKAPFIGGVGKWFTKSADNIANVAAKEGATVADISKAVGSTSTEMANNPVVKGFTSRVVDAVKKQGLKPSGWQVGFAGLGAYGIWMQADQKTLEKVAVEMLKDSFAKEGMTFDPNSENSKNDIQAMVKTLQNQRKGCKTEEECKGFLEKNPTIAKALGKIGKAGQAGGEFIGQFDVRNK